MGNGSPTSGRRELAFEIWGRATDAYFKDLEGCAGISFSSEHTWERILMNLARRSLCEVFSGSSEFYFYFRVLGAFEFITTDQLSCFVIRLGSTA